MNIYKWTKLHFTLSDGRIIKGRHFNIHYKKLKPNPEEALHINANLDLTNAFNTVTYRVSKAQ